jgi:O-antigen/teichoic acid export membrane protein
MPSPETRYDVGSNRLPSLPLPPSRTQTVDPPGPGQDIAVDSRDGSAREPEKKLSALPAREGAFWVIVALAAPRFIGAVTTIVLRRLLGPGIAGTFDLAFTPYSFLDGFRSIGTGPALVYEREIDRETADTAWALNMLTAVIVAGAAQLLARPVALYYGHPAIEGIFRALSIAYVLGSVGSVHYFLLLRNLDFRARSLPAIGQVVAAAAISLLLALWGFGVGALVVRQLVSAGAGALLLLAVYPYCPRLRLVPPIAWRLLRYGLWLSTAMTVLFVSQNVDVFIGGRIIRSTADIGFYTTSWSLAFLVAGVFGTISTSMIFPTLSRTQSDPEVLKQKLVKAIRQLGLALIPLACLIATLAPVLIVPLLGTKFASYQRLFPVLTILALYAGSRTLLSAFFEGYKAIGRPQIVLAYNGVKLAIMVPLMLVGAEHGVLGLAAAYVPLQIVEVPAALLLADRVLGVGPRRVWTGCRVWLAASSVMVVAVAACERLCLSVAHAGSFGTLIASGLIGVAVYVALVTVLDRDALIEARAVLIRGL